MGSKTRLGLRSLAEGLVKVGALQFGTVTLSNGKDSSYYVNLGGLSSYPGVYGLVVSSIQDLLTKKVRFDALCGVPMTGLAIASPIAATLKKPLVYVTPSRKSSDRVIEGEVRPDWKVVVVDDLAVSGKTILSVAESVEREGGEVKDAVVLIDRLEGASEALDKEGIRLRSVTNMMELAETLNSMELISRENLTAITKSVGGKVSRP